MIGRSLYVSTTHFAILFAGRAIYTPVIEAEIPNDGFLVGEFKTKAEAERLAAELRVLVAP